MTLKKILFWILLLNISLYANIIEINEDTKNLEILSGTMIYQDNTKSETIQSIKNKKFIQNNKSQLSYGYSPKFDIWIKFTLKNNSNKTITKVLEYGNPLTTHIDFYDNNKVFKDGLYQLNFQKESINPVFNIVLLPNQTKTFYLKASSNITTLIIKLNIIDEKILNKKVTKHNMILAMFFASMLILAFYNLFIYFFTKDKSYLYYVLYIFGAVFHQLVYTGFGNIYGFNQYFSILFVEYASLMVAFPVFAFALLVKSFLKISQYPLLNNILKTYLLVFPFLLSIFFITDKFAQYRNIFSIILLIYIIAITMYASIKRNRQAYFVLFGWLMVGVAFLSMYLSSTGIIKSSDGFKYLAEIALVLEAILFSIALADKIKQLELNKNKANMELILNQQVQTHKLEATVEEKTKDLSIALEQRDLLLKELNHRVKNNMQTIISLIRLQKNDIEDEKIKEMFSTIQNRINAMSHLHELLYNQNDLSQIDAYEYLYKIIDELQDSFETNNIKINYNIKTTLPTQQAVYCGLIVNELVTNSFKYAFDIEGGNINIKLTKQFDNYLLSISDDGKGYDSDIEKDTLGLVLVDTLATKQLKGKMKTSTKKGVIVIISWS